MGELERKIMDLLWDAMDARNEPLTGQAIRDLLSRDAGQDDSYPAITTVLTVLSRLEKKNLVSRANPRRPFLYQPTHSRVEHMADLMYDVLRSSSSEREAVLARFVGQVQSQDAAVLRKLLNK